VGRIKLKSSYALTTQQFCYVIIPGNAKTGRKDAVGNTGYAETKRLYNLPD
jgi:hypothetical protein